MKNVLLCFALAWTVVTSPSTSRALDDFGRTTAQCASDYGAALSTALPHVGVSTKYLGYIKGDLNLVIGFDEQGLSELNIYSKLAPGDFSAVEQINLLNRLKGESTWENTDIPYQWQRADGGGLAFYVASQKWMVIMNKHCMEKFIESHKKKQQGKQEDRP